MRSLPGQYRAFVLGASGAIGSALVARLRADPSCAEVSTWGHAGTPALDFEAPDSIAEVALSARSRGPWHLVLIATGMLQASTGGPEKRLADLHAEHLAASFAVNAIGPALALAQFVPQLVRDQRCLVAVLSAKVGSIGDNRLGGWYSYRASKAALNMIVKTAAIELARTHPQAWRHCTRVPSTRDYQRLSAARRSAGRPATRRATCSPCWTDCSPKTAAPSWPTTANACRGERETIAAFLSGQTIRVDEFSLAAHARSDKTGEGHDVVPRARLVQRRHVNAAALHFDHRPRVSTRTPS